jgi:predicted DNA-binding transcriptional regulator AlpA
MRREFHVRFCEGGEVRAPSATRLFLTEPEAAEACGVSPHTLKCWRLAHAGKGPPAVKVYDMVRYRAADVRAWLETMAGAA